MKIKKLGRIYVPLHHPPQLRLQDHHQPRHRIRLHHYRYFQPYFSRKVG